MLVYQIFFSLINLMLWLITTCVLVLILVLLLECCAALLLRTGAYPVQGLARPKVGVLVPAHNEALGIKATLDTLFPQLTEQDQLVVIADNCDDETASIARSAGATVIERHDTDRRGKGYALDYGLKTLASNPPEVVIVVDADCIVYPGTIEQIASLAATTGQPVQSAYVLDLPAQSSPKDAISALAFLVKNLVRPRGLAHLGWPCLLTGTGMAFPWSILCQISLASGNLVEDMQLAIDLAITGYPTLFCPEGQVTGVLPKQLQAAASQRTRWEHGHLKTLKTQVPRLLRASIQQRRFDLLVLALDLAIPPLSFLVMLWLGMFIIALVAAGLGVASAPLTLLILEGCFLAGAILLAWVAFGRSRVPIQALLAIPFYILWKIPLYFAFFVRPQTEWVRTERDEEKCAPKLGA
ncbi:MAG: glycosyltransferase family 2 protein [Leptolyngbyaceae cyanobacterium]